MPYWLIYVTVMKIPQPVVITVEFTWACAPEGESMTVRETGQQMARAGSGETTSSTTGRKQSELEVGKAINFENSHPVMNFLQQGSTSE